ncbi:MAG TPA: SOS response-associated peptidase [Thermoanaerobaculia bacterium]|nr:SOS response-associated peptidase [Thermoanaerobaculia bacterium]
MCGRYTLSSPVEVVADLFEITFPARGTEQLELPDLPPRYNLAPTQEALVALVREPGAPRTLALLRWGLIPYWAKEASIGNRMINARSEGVAEKPAYRFSFKKKRCLIPADGFYEWKKEGKAKQPYLIRHKDHRPFAFAGLWSTWKNPEGGLVETFTILTTDANGTIKGLHDRMPVVLDRADFGLWLDPKVEDKEKLQALLKPAPDADFETLPVSKAVNSPAHDAPDCIEPLVG